MSLLPEINEVTKQYLPIAQKLMRKFDLYLGHIDLEKVKFVNTTTDYHRKYDARCHMVGVPLCYFVNAFYVVEFIYPNCEELSPEQMEIVTLHELMHIAEGGTDPDDKAFMKTRNHDREDFVVIMREYGIDWNYASLSKDKYDDD